MCRKTRARCSLIAALTHLYLSADAGLTELCYAVNGASAEKMTVHPPVLSGLRLREAACASDDFPLWIDAPWGSVTHRCTVVGERSMCMFTRFLKFLRRLGQIHPAVIAIAPDRTW
jgi:hypothetical protein